MLELKEIDEKLEAVQKEYQQLDTQRLQLQNQLSGVEIRLQQLNGKFALLTEIKESYNKKGEKK